MIIYYIFLVLLIIFKIRYPSGKSVIEVDFSEYFSET